MIVSRYLSTCMQAMTFFVTLFILVPFSRDPKRYLLKGNGLYHHVLCPILSTASYILIEEHAGTEWMWMPIAVTLVYGLVMMILNYLEKADGPYPFFRVRHQSVLVTVFWIIALLAMITGFSILIAILAK